MNGIDKYNSIVVKIEFSTLTRPDGTLDPVRMERMAMILSNLHNSGKQLLLVTSGAIALGTLKLKLQKPPAGLIEQQATAAVGQAELIKIYQSYFEIFNQRVAQVLLTSDIVDHPERKQNALNTFNTLFEMNIIPVINENDAVSTEDIEFMDNYPLTLNVARMSGSKLIIIRGNEEGKYYLLNRGNSQARKIESEESLIKEVEESMKHFDEINDQDQFPEKMDEVIL